MSFVFFLASSQSLMSVYNPRFLWWFLEPCVVRNQSVFLLIPSFCHFQYKFKTKVTSAVLDYLTLVILAKTTICPFLFHLNRMLKIIRRTAVNCSIPCHHTGVKKRPLCFIYNPKDILSAHSFNYCLLTNDILQTKYKKEWAACQKFHIALSLLAQQMLPVLTWC